MYELVLEPERRDTTSAIILACAHLATEQSANDDDTVVVMPIDTYADQEYYDKVAYLDKAVQANVSDLVLLGVEPTYPSEKYGYIVTEGNEGNLRKVAQFVEKPSEELATELISKGALWNCGAFAFRLGYIRALSCSYIQQTDFKSCVMSYKKLPKRSFDYEVVEKSDSISVVPYSGAWKDLGTWNTLTEEMRDLTAGRVVLDENTCENVHVINETGFPMVVSGLNNTVVVATPDGILVSGKEASAGIKNQVAQAAESRPMYEQRLWGEYRVIDSSVFPDGTKALTKELVVKPGRQLSYQKHKSRSEIWTIVSGCGEVVLGDLVREVHAGSVVNIEACERHACRSSSELHIIEVQLGDTLSEEDIERFGYYWGD